MTRGGEAEHGIQEWALGGHAPHGVAAREREMIEKGFAFHGEHYK